MNQEINLNEVLFEAVVDFNLQLVSDCLKQGANPNYYKKAEGVGDDQTHQPTTPLRMVIFRISDNFLNDDDLKVYAKIAHLLLEYGADPIPALALAESRYGQYQAQIEGEENLFLEVYKIIATAKNKL